MNDASARRLGWLGSLLLHALPLLGGWWLASHPAEPPPRSQLTLELFGMLSARQIQAKAPDQVVPPPKPQPRHEARKAVPPAPRVDPDAVKVATQAEVKTAEPPPPEIAPTDLREDDAQTAQVVQPEDEKLLIARYVAALSKSLQSKLVYPREARRSGAVGSPTIAFTLAADGSIVPGTLALHRSCGHPLLDENALQSARDSAPFARPPRSMKIVVAVSFAEDR